MPNWLIELSLFSIVLILNYLNCIDCLNNDQLKRYEIINFQSRAIKNEKKNNNNQELAINQGFLEIKGKLLLVEINAFEQHFRLVALAGNQLEVRIYDSRNKYATYSNESYFNGYLLNEPDSSKVIGYITKKRFIGLIYKDNQIYHLDLVGFMI